MRLASWWALAGLAYPTYRALKELGFETFAVRDYYLKLAIVEYLYETGRPVHFGSRAYGGRLTGQGKDSIAEAWEGLGGAERCFILPGGIPVWAKVGTTEGLNGVGVMVRYPRFLVDPDALVRDAMLAAEGRAAKERPTKYEYCMVTDTGHTQHKLVSEGEEVRGAYDIEICRKILWQPERRQSSGRLEAVDLPMTEEQTTAFDEVQRWFDSRDWYSSHKVPWRRGYLLHGPPGTGKTTFVQAVARHLDVRLVCFDLATFSNSSFPKSWRQWTQGGQPQVILLEDLDSVFEGRKNIAQGSIRGDSGASAWNPGLSWDCLLSVLDGVQVSEGVLLFVTTNRPERLDSSLACVKDGKTEVRPGRIDRAVPFGPLTAKGRLQVAERILMDAQKAKDLVGLMENATVADIQEACVHAALKEFWS